CRALLAARLAHAGRRALCVLPSRAALALGLPQGQRGAGAGRRRPPARALAVEHHAALRAGRARCAAGPPPPARSPARERPLLLDERPALAPRDRRARRGAAPDRPRPAGLCGRHRGRARLAARLADRNFKGRGRALPARRGSAARRRLHHDRPPRAAHPQRTRKREQRMNKPNPSPEQFSQAAKVAGAMRAEIGKALIGQPEVIDAVLCALLAGGHVLVEGVPGLGKTLLVKALARTISGTFGRIQFTPDLMPADVTGHTLYDPKNQVFT